MALANKEKYEKAIEKYTQVINNNNKIQLAYYNRGLCYLSTGEYLKSLEDFNTILGLKTIDGGTFVFELNSKAPGTSEETRYQVSYDDGIYGRAQARMHLDSLQFSYADFQSLVDRNYQEKVFCMLFQADIWHEMGNDSTACEFVQKARRIANRQDEINDCNNSLNMYCETKNDR